MTNLSQQYQMQSSEILSSPSSGSVSDGYNNNNNNTNNSHGVVDTMSGNNLFKIEENHNSNDSGDDEKEASGCMDALQPKYYAQEAFTQQHLYAPHLPQKRHAASSLEELMSANQLPNMYSSMDNSSSSSTSPPLGTVMFPNKRI